MNRFFLKGDFAKNSLILVSGTLLAQSINLISLPFLARLYTPSDFGLLALFMAVSNVVTTGVTLRYEAHIVVPESDDEAQGLAKLALFFGLVLSIGISILLWFIPTSVKAMIGISDIEALIPFVGLSGLMGAVIAVASSWLNRIKDYKKIAYSKVVQAIGLIIPSFALYYYPVGYNGLVAAQIISLIVTALFLSLALFLIFNIKQHQNLPSIARQHQAAPKFLLPTALLDTVTMQLPVILITAWFGSSMAGQFSMAWKVLYLPMALIGSSVGQIFFQKASYISHKNKNEVFDLYLKISIILGLMSLIPCLLVFLIGESIFILIFGSEWHEAGKIAELLVLSATMYFIFSPTSSAFIVIKKHKILLVFTLIQLLYRSSIVMYTNNVMDYVKMLVLMEVINVLLIEYFLIMNLSTKAKIK